MFSWVQLLDKYLTRYFVYPNLQFRFWVTYMQIFFWKKKYLSIGIIKSLIHVMFILIVIILKNEKSGHRCLGAVMWHSKIGWSDWPKLIREFIFYPNFGGQYLGFLWLDLCDSGLVGKPLSRTICVPIFRRISQIVAEILRPKDGVYYSLLYVHVFYIWLPLFMQTSSEGTHRLAHGLPLLL